jgi:transcriptional regulator with XRE-family HTH domain
MSVDAKNYDIAVANRIKNLRKFRGISQKKLGDHIGVSFAQVQKYEKAS